MANIVNPTYSGKFNLPIPVGRLNATPADSTEIWAKFSDAQAYAATGATAYVGQIIYVQETGKHYSIKDTAGTLEQLGGDISNILRGYYLNDKFYTDSTYTVEMVKDNTKIYVDHNSGQLYTWNGAAYQSASPAASSTVAGLMKLYSTHGVNEDGTMTQKAITNSIEEVRFSVDESDDECLVLEKPW